MRIVLILFCFSCLLAAKTNAPPDRAMGLDTTAVARITAVGGVGKNGEYKNHQDHDHM